MNPNQKNIKNSNIEDIFKTNKEESSNIEEKLIEKLQNKEDETDKDIDVIQNLEDYKECSICLEPIIIGKKLHCGHVNHLKCLK